MIVTLKGESTEMDLKLIREYPEYRVFERSSDGVRIHIDYNGEVIVYKSYIGYEFALLHESDDNCVADLGDRIVIQRYVGGIYNFYNYHICKKTRAPIAYFDSPADQPENMVHLPAYRIWASCDLGAYLYVLGMYDNKGRIVKKSDNTPVSISESDGTQTSDLLGLHRLNDSFVAVCTKNGWFHLDLATMRSITYIKPENGETLSYFDASTMKGSKIEVRKGWRKYGVDPARSLITHDRFKWSPSRL